MRSRFDEQLEQLNIELIKIGGLCEEAISTAVKALVSGKVSLIGNVIAIDRDIDHKEREIEALCLKLLLQQQPVASDLRAISAAMKMVSDMERIGDQAADIAEITKFATLGGNGSDVHIEDMAKATIKMVTDSIDSFVNKDLALARAVVESDDIVDDLFCKVKNELIELIGRDRTKGEYCLDLLMIAKYFERIGDHATNIAEWVEFSITGVHKGEKL